MSLVKLLISVPPPALHCCIPVAAPGEPFAAEELHKFVGLDERHFKDIPAAVRKASGAEMLNSHWQFMYSKWDDVVWKYDIHKNTAHKNIPPIFSLPLPKSIKYLDWIHL